MIVCMILYSEFSVRGLSLFYPAHYYSIAEVKSFQTLYDIPILSGCIGMSYTVGKLLISNFPEGNILPRFSLMVGTLNN